MLSRKQFLRFTFVLVVIAFITTGVFMSIRNNQDNIVNSVVQGICSKTFCTLFFVSVQGEFLQATVKIAYRANQGRIFGTGTEAFGKDLLFERS